jgi:hypothetical protein
MPLALQPQEIPFDHPDSCNMFRPGPEKPLVATPGAIQMHTQQAIFACLTQLHALAEEHDGIDYLQVFTDPNRPESLWFIEDGPGGAITALLPSEH